MTHSALPFALFIRGPHADIFDISDALGFSDTMAALAISVFEDGATTSHVQALFATQAEAETAMAPYVNTPKLECFVSQLEDEDWVSKSQAGLPPVIAGPYCVYGAHDADNIPDGTLYPVQIDAGLAFGTGHHGTTKGCLLALYDLMEDGFMPNHVLDLGCGAGTLAIAYAKATGKAAFATDIDPDAVGVTQDNAKINGVHTLITAVKADGFDHPSLTGQTFDLIFANILAEPLMELAPDIKNALNAQGRVILSGILDEKADKVVIRFQDIGLNVTPRPSVNGWTNLIGIKP